MDAINKAKAAGFTKVQTFGPQVPLDDWTPYGVRPSELKSVSLVFAGDCFEERSETPAHPGSEAFLLGRWPLIR